LLIAVVLVIVALIVILAAAELFTNSVEWLGHSLELAEGAVGSVLAAVGTAMPETMIPIIAILFIGTEEASEIGIGAILGAPFLLSTAAFAVTGLGVILFRKRRSSGTSMNLDAAVIRRDLGYFLLVYLFAIACSFLPGEELKYAGAFVLLASYVFYVYRTFTHEGEGSDNDGEGLNQLHLLRIMRRPHSPPLHVIIFQFIGALALIVVGAQLFVSNLEHIAHDIGVPALALALIIAPLATELPEKFNSIIWVRQGKDTLAMGNISGAMVFQSCIPVSVGVLFTSWELTETALVSAAIALASTALVYVSMSQLGYLSAKVLARAGLFWVGFVGYVVLKLVR
jgi:cation:H+ antiporter